MTKFAQNVQKSVFNGKNLRSFSNNGGDWMSQKEKFLKWLDSLIPDDFECGNYYLTFCDDGSATIHIDNTDEYNEWRINNLSFSETHQEPSE